MNCSKGLYARTHSDLCVSVPCYLDFSAFRCSVSCHCIPDSHCLWGVVGHHHVYDGRGGIKRQPSNFVPVCLALVITMTVGEAIAQSSGHLQMGEYTGVCGMYAHL